MTDDLATFLTHVERLFTEQLRKRAGGVEDLRLLGHGSIRAEFKVYGGRVTLTEFLVGSTDTPEKKG